MAWIEEIEVKEASGKLRELYNRITARTKGNVANILKVHSLHPEAMEAHLNLYETIMFGESGLSRAQREMIAVVVSNANKCHYWTVHHGESLRLAANDDHLMSDIVQGIAKANISKEEKVMLDYAQKLTRESYRITEKDIKELRNAGFSERDIFDINQVAAYFNYVNRIADGLGVTLETE